MYLQKLIQKLKEVKCNTAEERKNIFTNIKICEMQLPIIDKFLNKNKKLL